MENSHDQSTTVLFLNNETREFMNTYRVKRGLSGFCGSPDLFGVGVDVGVN